MGRFLNNIELLTKDDMNNIDIRKKCLNIVEEKVDEYEQQVLEDTILKMGINFDILDKSYVKYYNLSALYNRTNEIYHTLFLSIAGILLFFLGLTSPEFQNGNEKIILLIFTIGIFSIIGIFDGIKKIVIRRKIVKNFKEMSIKYK